MPQFEVTLFGTREAARTYTGTVVVEAETEELAIAAATESDDIDWELDRDQPMEDPIGSIRVNQVDLLDDVPRSKCDNCSAVHQDVELQPIADLTQRVAPGEPLPTGECPDCGALCHRIGDTDDEDD